MVSKEISSHVVSLGCSNKNPKGGIAQVLYCYEHYVFDEFNFVTISRKSNKWNNLALFTRGLFKFLFILVFKKNIKIVHIHTSQRKSFVRSNIFMCLAKMFSKKTVLHIHGGGFKDYYYEKPDFVSKCLKKCDRIIVLSEEWKHFFNSVGFECEIVENIITKPEECDVGVDDNRIHILFLGLITKLKGIYDLVEVNSEHKDEFIGNIILHVGGNGEIDVIKKMITGFGLEEIVRFEGWVTGKKKIQLMNLCDIYILPSYVEGLPLSILEAMSYNMVIISTRVGGIPSLVTEDKNGFLFEPGDKKAIYSSIKSLIDDKDLLLSMGKGNSELVVDYYPENVALKLSAIYNSLL